MITYFPFNSVDGDRKYSATDLAAFNTAQMTTGVYYNHSYKFLVEKLSNSMGLSIYQGGAIINGYQILNDTIETLTVSAADSTNPRIDTVVLKLDLNTNARNITIALKKGTAAASPVAPTLTQTSTVYEFPLANVPVAAGATNLNSATLTDRRVYSNSIGTTIVAGKYTGNGSATQTISLAFTPDWVYVLPSFGVVTYDNGNVPYSAMAYTSNPAGSALSITTNGFIAGYSSASYRLNANATVYHYLAGKN